ncbi:MAG: FecR domain-containing protein [Rhizobium sp.]|uniref:FecR family protein n=1 Tax=Rhizobium sp. SYY.PMSO TaxID=3382192 RepID=UPI000DD5F102
MQQDTGDDDRLFEEAMNLIIRLQNDRSNPVALNMIRHWRAMSPEHERIWAEVLEIHAMSGKVLTDQYQLESAPGISRRKLMLMGALLLGTAATGGLAGPGLIARASADFATTTAEIKRVALPDGSVLTLGPDSGIKVAFSERRRDIRLLYGMAFAEVAKDADRPFSVGVDEITATALGTAFDVSDDDGFVTISVDHGLVQVDASIVDRAQLSAGQWLRVDTNGKRFDRGARNLGQIAVWRDGMIVADNEPISAVIARITRWQSGKVLVADPGLGSLPISGVFDLNQPLRALEAVVQPYGGRVRQISPWLTVITKI